MKDIVLYIKSWILPINGILISIIGFIVLIGWHTGNEVLIRLNIHHVPMVYNTALELIALGVGVLFCSFKWKKTTQIIGLVIVIFSAITALQYIIDINFGIDELFFKQDLSSAIDPSGRMAINTAICFIFAGGSLYLISKENSKKSAVVAFILSCFIAGVAGVPLLGYLIGFESAAGLTNFSKMAFHTAIAFVIFATSLQLFLFLVLFETKEALVAIPLGVAMAVVTSTFIFWHAVRVQDVNAIEEAAHQNALHLKIDIENEITEAVTSLMRMADRWEILRGYSEALWDVDAQNYLRDINIISNIFILDQSLNIIEEKQVGEGQVFGIDFTSEEIRSKIVEQRPFLFFKRSTNRIISVSPLTVNGALEGALIGVISGNDLLNQTIKNLNLSNYFIIIQSGEHVVFSSGNHGARPEQIPAQEDVNPSLVPWTINLYVTDLIYALKSSNLSFYIISTGLFFACIFSLAVYLWFDSMIKEEIIKKTVEDLRTANKMALQGSIAKGLFLANMSHEIRTPLNVIIGTIQLFNEIDLNETQKKYINRINSASRSLLFLINDILDFSKIESGTIQLEYTEVSIEQIIKNIVTDQMSKAQQKLLPIFVVFPIEPLPQIIADKYRLQQVINNLVSNAIKFTETGFILITVEIKITTPTMILLRVEIKDTGIGITAENIPHLFEKFIQFETAYSKKVGGVGLGLPICKRLVEIMGGTIGGNSEIGKGSLFWFEIPFSIHTSAPASYGLPSKKIFLCDRIDKEREIIERLLKGWGLTIESAGIQQSEIVIICAECVEMFQMAKDRKLPIIIIESSEQQVMPEGIVAHISRPIIPSELVEALRKCM